MNKLLYYVLTKDNDLIRFEYIEGFEEYHVYSMITNKGFKYSNSDDAITLINVVEVESIKRIRVSNFFVDNCKDELIRRCKNNELTREEKMLLKACI